MRDGVSELSIGKAGEHLVCADLLLNGHEAFLAAQGAPYDVIGDIRGKLIRIQVKTSQGACRIPQRAGEITGYVFNIRRCGRGGRRKYDESEIDLYALVSVSERVIGYIPAKSCGSCVVLRSEAMRGQYPSDEVKKKRESVLSMRKNGCSYQAINEAFPEYKYGSIVSICTRPSFGQRARYLSELTLDVALSAMEGK